jgi:Tol biopolymer transport system component
LTGPAAPLVDGVASDTARGAIFESSLSGTLVYRRAVPGRGSALAWSSSNGLSETIEAPPAAYVMPRLSPDGKRLALTIADEALHNVWVYDLRRKSISRLTFDNEPQFLEVWSPDGQFLVFRSGSSLAWIRSDGSGKVERQASSGLYPLPNAFSPDGKWLTMALNHPSTGWDIGLAPASEAGGVLSVGTPRIFLPHPGGQYAASMSPDGRWIAYSSDESGRGEIYVEPFAPEGPARKGRWQVSREGGIYAVWSPKGHQLFFRSADLHVMAASYETEGESFIAGPPRVWTKQRLDSASGLPSFDVAADGRVVGVFETGSAAPETHLRVLLNLNEELRRRQATHPGGPLDSVKQ